MNSKYFMYLPLPRRHQLSHQLKLHSKKILLIFSLLLTSLVLDLTLAQLKPLNDIDWLDIVSEGGSAMVMAIWMFFIIASRPIGRVTNLLSLGLGFMFIALWQDASDEFFVLPENLLIDQWIENIAMPIGIILMTYGLYHWYQEQLHINEQLRKREQLFREHRHLDKVTQLNKVDLLKQQLANIADNSSLLLIDIDNFSQINRLYGSNEGDCILHETSEILLLNLRRKDFICRFAGDRFAVLLPATNLADSKRIAEELQQAIKHFAYKHKSNDQSLNLSISIGLIQLHNQEDYAVTIKRVSQALEQAKQQTGLCLAS